MGLLKGRIAGEAPTPQPAGRRRYDLPSVARPDSPFDFAQGKLGRLSLAQVRQ